MPLTILRDLLKTPASRNAGAAYLAFGSTALWGLVSIPIAVAFLEPEQIGLWAIVNALLSYLAWADLGIGAAISRLIAPAVTDKNQQEMNRWWTATRVTLFILGLIVIVIGQLLCLVIQPITQCSQEVIRDSRLLLGGGALILGLTFPIRGVAGILLAEHRYHWAPLMQAASPWVNLSVFYLLLKSGDGLKAYLYAHGASQLFNWLCYKFLILKGPNRYYWDRGGLTLDRFKKLLGFGSNIAVIGGVEAVLRSLPNLMVAKIAALSIVPIYNFSSRLPILGANLLNQTIRSFHPGLQRLYISGEKELFAQRHRQVCILTMSVAIVGAAMTLLVNGVLIQALAGYHYFAGHATNTWFAISLITTAFSITYRILLTLSGNMGKASIVSTIKIVTAMLAGSAAWSHSGLTGIAATFALIHLIDGMYAYYRGAKNCGFQSRELSGSIVTITCTAIILTWLCGSLMEHQSVTGMSLEIFGKQHSIPALPSILTSIILGMLGITMGALQLMQISKQYKRE